MITMLLLVILTVLGIYAVGLSTSGLESVSGEERERAARNAAEAGAWYGLDRLPLPLAERGSLLPNGARYDVTVSPTGTEPLPGYDSGWMRATFHIRSTGIAPRANKIRRVTEAEAAFGPVPSGTGYFRGKLPAPLSRSAPVLVGPPSSAYLDSRDPSARNAFAGRHARRKPVHLLYADDGTLRAHDAGFSDPDGKTPGYATGTGEPIWTFLPGFLKEERAAPGGEAESLPAAAEGPLAVADIRLAAVSGPAMTARETGWRTVAVAAAGPRGRAVFALDITDPASPGYPSLMWEVAKRQVPILGQALSAPVIGKVRAPAGRLDAPGETVDRWVVLLGAGKAIRRGRPDRVEPPASETLVSRTDPGDEGRAILVLEASTGKVLQILTHPAMGEVVASPAVAPDLEGYIERVYLGDLSGNLWRATVGESGDFDLGGGPFFSVAGEHAARAIHGRCAVAQGEGEYPGLWVFFGTGDVEDPPDGSPGGIYAVYDDAPSGRVRGALGMTLTERDLADATRFFARIGEREPPFPIPGGKYRGWHAALPGNGETLFSAPKVFFSNLYFTTYEPASGNRKEGGTVRVYGFGMAPGKNPGFPALPGLDRARPGVPERYVPTARVRKVGTGGMPSGPEMTFHEPGRAHVHVGFSAGSDEAIEVPAPDKRKSILSWKNVQP